MREERLVCHGDYELYVLGVLSEVLLSHNKVIVDSFEQVTEVVVVLIEDFGELLEQLPHGGSDLLPLTDLLLQHHDNVVFK